MNASTLHTAARRYLIERAAELVEPTSATHPLRRRDLVEATLVEVERLDPENLPEPNAVAKALNRAAGVAATAAIDAAIDAATDDAEAEAVAAECELFRARVDGWEADPDLEVEPLPYRRVLTDTETDHWRGQLEERWGVADLQWYPSLSGFVPPGVLILDAGSMWQGIGPARVRDVLRAAGRSRVVELHPGEPSYLLDLDLFTPTRAGFDEGVWTDDRLDWIAYASHEIVVAFGGLLATGLPQVWKQLDRWRQ